MNKPKLFALACLATLAVAGCKPQPPAEPAAPADAAPAVVATVPTDAVAAVPTGVSSADASMFDQKAFAGTFKGTLPCADCPGIDTALQLKADGSFLLSETFLGQAGAATRIDGTWTTEADDQHIRLDPNSKAEPDRQYAITANDRISQLGADGKPAARGVDQSLKRDAATQ